MDWTRLFQGFTQPFFVLHQTPVSAATIAQFLLLVVAIVVAARLLRRFLRRRLLPRTHLEPSVQDLVAGVSAWAVIVLGMMIALSTLGFDLTSLTVLGGSLGIGIGFGLRNIVENFISGLIILAERPIQVGHRVEVGDTAGTVTRIGPRSTTILTNDNITMILPNSDFISERVVNWSHGGDRRVRLRVPLGVAYGSDLRRVQHLLLQVAGANPDALADPEPRVVFTRFGDDALELELRVWTETMSHRPGSFRSDLNFAIWETFEREGIEIPYPHRDVRIREPVQVELGGQAPSPSPAG